MITADARWEGGSGVLQMLGSPSIRAVCNMWKQITGAQQVTERTGLHLLKVPDRRVATAI